MDRSRCVVIGGGVVGLSVAWELLEKGRSVLVLEGRRLGAGATQAAAGMLAPVSEAEVESAELLTLGRDSLERYPHFLDRLQGAAGVDCRHRTEGTLWVAVDRDEAEELAHLEETLLERGLPVRRLEAREIATREPHLSPRVRDGLYVEQDQQIDPRELVRALERAIVSAGGSIVEEARVSGIVEQHGRVGGVRGKDSRGNPFELAAADVVLATGAWLGSDIDLPLVPPRVRPVKGQLLRLRGPALIDHVVRTPEIYLVPRIDGELLVGATVEEMGFDVHATAGAVLDLLRHAFDVLPAVYDLQLQEVSVGLRPATEDHLPRIGNSGIEGLWYAAGHYRGGVLLAPATAHYLAGWIEDGAMPGALAPFQQRQVAAASGGGG